MDAGLIERCGITNSPESYGGGGRSRTYEPIRGQIYSLGEFPTSVNWLSLLSSLIWVRAGGLLPLLFKVNFYHAGFFRGARNGVMHTVIPRFCRQETAVGCNGFLQVTGEAKVLEVLSP